MVAFYRRGTLLYDPTTGGAVNNNICWPHKAVRFSPQWPTNPPRIVIASQQGTGPIDPVQFANWELYYQNDSTQAGFNPNDEHALRRPLGAGEAVFALRNDLGTPTTSEPYVLIRYRDPSSGGQWRMKVWKVVAEETPWFFRYAARAGVVIQPPFPLSSLAPAPQTAGVSGPYWRDRKLFFWAKAAGDDGGAADIVMRFFYPVQNGFFFPGTNVPPVGENIPLLDLAAGTPRTPIDVHYDITWPATPELRVAETLVEPKFSLPSIAGQLSVEIIYDQSAAQGHGPAVKLIDPTVPYDVDLAQLPDNLKFVTEGDLQFTSAGGQPQWADGGPIPRDAGTCYWTGALMRG